MKIASPLILGKEGRPDIRRMRKLDAEEKGQNLKVIVNPPLPSGTDPSAHDIAIKLCWDKYLFYIITAMYIIGGICVGVIIYVAHIISHK